MIDMKLDMVYWQDEGWFVGRLLKYPDVASQGETLEELQDNIRDAFDLMYMENIPENHQVVEVTV
jgi:predicted RNase H-like HicB family nuclease